MSYSRYYTSGWLSGETGATPIIPEALNHMETGIQTAQTVAEAALPKTGGTVSGATVFSGKLTANGQMVLKSGVTYGTSLPSAGTAGRIFFKKVST